MALRDIGEDLYVVLGGWLDLVNLKVFSNLNNSMILYYDSMEVVCDQGRN